MTHVAESSENSPLERFVRSIPKTETHLHIEGSLPYEMLHELDPGKFPENPEFRQPGYKFPNFVEFEDLLIAHAMAWYTSAERYFEASSAIFRKLADQNVKYVETSVHLAITDFIDANGRDIVQAVKSAAPEGMDVRVIGALTRDGYTDTMKVTIDSLHTWDELDGIDMHGREWLELEDWAEPIWTRFRDQGKIIKVHAGEFGGPEKIYEALNQLGAQRVQHGVRATEDPELVKRMASEGVILDTCPISNEKLQVFPSMKDHSIRQLFDAGVICTINTDDPLCFANTICDEYLALASELDFTKSELGELAKNGFMYARMDENQKTAFIEEIDTLVGQS